MPNLVQRSALALIGLLAISSTAFSKEMEPLPYKEALAAFNAAGHDSPGVWLCGYSLTDQHFATRNGLSPSLIEVDEQFLYIRNDGEIIELETNDIGKPVLLYRSRDGEITLTMKVLRQFNKSEYGESHDRHAEATLRAPHTTISAFLLGRSCGI
ncbi:hypothetical protein [Aquipseudomonas alcaligenes]|nr:hypothetical protein [Pseudomonas alcaligenes]SUD20509.1 Uncharacterised protein [Pseudomonas alcaligenes]